MLIERLGVSNVVVRAKTLDEAEQAEIRKKTVGLSERDLSAIREAVPNVALALPKNEIDPYKILSATGKSEGLLYGLSPAPSTGRGDPSRGLCRCYDMPFVRG